MPEMTAEQAKRLEIVKLGEGWVNSICSVGCLGCNGNPCCWDMASQDFIEGYGCACAEEKAAA